jgi:hypothetical protein
MYSSDTQLAMGVQGEEALDQFFGRWYDITPVDMTAQRAGIDRVFVERESKQSFTVEYKTDATAGRTGNAFVETISIDPNPGQHRLARRLGWAVRSQATALIYYIPDPETIYLISMRRLRRQLPRWREEYPVRRIPNRGYHTVGLLVPLDEFECIARKVF